MLQVTSIFPTRELPATHCEYAHNVAECATIPHRRRDGKNPVRTHVLAFAFADAIVGRCVGEGDVEATYVLLSL